MRSLSKRVVAVGIIIVAVLGLSLATSYIIAKRAAEDLVRNAKVPVFAPLDSRPVLFVGERFVPHWEFRYELDDKFADFPFNVHVSLSGQVFLTSASRINEDFKLPGLRHQ